MRRPHLPLLLASEYARSTDERFPLDRIRMQKAVFLLTKRGPEKWSLLYDYQPYNWGPYSPTLVHDLEAWVRTGELAVEDYPHSRYGQYETTPAGEAEAERVWGELTPAQQDFVRSVRRFVTRRSFNRLLRDVYAAYPDYATKSQFTG